MAPPANRERLADAIFQEQMDLTRVLTEVLVIPSVPDAWLLAHAVGGMKTRAFDFLDTAARFDRAALVDAFDLWKQDDTRVLPGNSLYRRAVSRSTQIRKAGGASADLS